MKAVRAKSVSFGESDSLQKERAQRHFEAVRATLQDAGDEAPRTGCGTLQPQLQRDKYRDSDVFSSITENIQIKDASGVSKPNAHFHKDACPPTTFEIYSTDFGESCSTKKLSEGIAKKPVNILHIEGNQVLKVDEPTKPQSRTGHFHSHNNNQHVSRTGRFPRPVTAHELTLASFASTMNDVSVYKSSEMAYIQDTLPSKHRLCRPVTTHECTFPDDYSQTYSKRSVFSSRQNNTGRDFYTLQKQGAQVRQATIPHGYRTTSYRMAMSGQKHNKGLGDVAKSTCQAISETAHLNVIQKQDFCNVVSSTHRPKSRVTRNDDYVSMDNLHDISSSIAAKQNLAADVRPLAHLSIGKDVKEGQDKQRTVSINDSKKSISVPMNGTEKTPLKGILKNPTKHTEVKSKNQLSTFDAKRHIKSSSSSLGDGIAAVKKNGSPDKTMTNKIANHKALIHHSADELRETADPRCHKNLGTNNRFSKEITGIAVDAHDGCSGSREQMIRPNSKSEDCCLDLKKPIWPAPPPPLQGALTSYSCFKSDENEPTLAHSHKRCAPPVPIKAMPSKGTQDLNSTVPHHRNRLTSLTKSQQTKEHGDNVQTSTMHEKGREKGGPSGELIECLRQIARSGMNMSSKSSLDSKEKGRVAAATNPDYVNYDWYTQHYANHGSNRLNTSHSEDDYFSDDDEFDDDFGDDDSDADETDSHER